MRKRKIFLKGIKNIISDLERCYCTIINLGWYCSTIVNFFRIASPDNASFMGFGEKIWHIQSFTTPNIDAFRDWYYR